MQIIHSVDEDTHRWLKAAADADGCGVGEIVRRCIAFTREAAQPEPVLLAQDRQLRLEAEQRAAARRQREAEIAEKKRELAALMAEEPVQAMHVAGEIEHLIDHHELARHRAQIVGMPPDEVIEPRAEEIDVPADPDDDVYAPEPLPVAARALPSMLDPMARMPGRLTRPAGVNPERAIGTQQGDGQGNVIRENFKHLGFAAGRVR